MKLRWNFSIIFIAILSFNFLNAQHPDVKTLEIGSSAPDFSLPGTDGKIYTLADFEEFPILVVLFTCNHCPTAQAYEDKFINMVNEFRPQGVGFVGISPNSPQALSLAELGYSDMGDEMEDMKQRVKDKNYNFPYLFDGDTEEASIKYGPVATPHVFIFDKNRKLKYTGRIDDTENPYIKPKTTDMRNAIVSLLNNKEVKVSKTKTFGCSVKWAWKNEWTLKLQDDWSKSVQINCQRRKKPWVFLKRSKLQIPITCMGEIVNTILSKQLTKIGRGLYLIRF